jgi:undecaprenyl diphosphate synthase
MTALQPKAQDLPPPVHVAIIMDGNGRWATSRGLPRAAGHRRGADAVREAIKAAAELGVSYLTLFGFSSENWKRPEAEVRDLMGLLRLYLRREIDELHRNGVKVRVVGDRTGFDADIVSLIVAAETRTASNPGLTVTIALNYGGRQEILCAAKRLAAQVASGETDPQDIDEEVFSNHLFTAGIPDPDLLIRTSGEKRISNFMLWQCAYSELVFLEVLWPDFSKSDLEAAIRDFWSRERRWGSVG